MAKRHENVWLAVAGVVENEHEEILVVMKKYSGLKGNWSFPAGFVKAGETIDEAVCREILEETGIKAHVQGVIAIRSGVIKNTISDNMIIFHLKTSDTNIIIQEEELMDAAFFSKQELVENPKSSLLIKELLGNSLLVMEQHSEHEPGNIFQYTKYHVFY